LGNWDNLTILMLSIVQYMQDSNNISQKGFKYLSKMNCCQITTIDLSKNNNKLVRNDIWNEGANHFLKVNWKHLHSLYLSRNSLIKMKQN